MKKIINVDINRVEGDLELKLETENGIITNAWSSGTMFRGFEKLLKGRNFMDSLVITPRVCGICGTAHLYSAVTAIETALQIPVAPDGIRVRNVCLLAEEIQSDSRHAFLMYTIDFINSKYQSSKYFSSVKKAFEPLTGNIYKETVIHTKKMLEIVSLFGGQWPHSSYMVPGGVTASPDPKSVRTSLAVTESYIHWYETQILGCSIEKWLSIESAKDLQDWIHEKPEHRQSAAGLYILFGRGIGLHLLGKGAGSLLSYGNYYDPDNWKPPYTERALLRRAGFITEGSSEIQEFNDEEISEHVRYSWYKKYEGGLHPLQGITEPDYRKDDRYSWAKAPRYGNSVMETGPLSELVIGGDPLITDFFRREGSNAWLRQFSRIHRPAKSLVQLKETLHELLKNSGKPWFTEPVNRMTSGEGRGLIHAARGALGHWVRIENDLIDHYQIITPTGWNASPRDDDGIPGHLESTLIGTKIENEEDPVEIGHIVRSHDACLVCTVHILDSDFVNYF